MKVKRGEWYWTLKWIDCFGAMGARIPEDRDHDWVLQYGQVMYVGEHLCVFKNSCGEWTSDYDQKFRTMQEVRTFFESRGYKWATEEWAKALEEHKETWPNYVLCAIHGVYDGDELCWECEKELRNVDQG